MFATAEHEKERLQYFVSPEGRDDLYQYNQRERRTVLEVMSSVVMNYFASSVVFAFKCYVYIENTGIRGFPLCSNAI